MKEEYLNTNTSTRIKPMIKVNSMARNMVKMNLNQEIESHIANCIGSKLIDVKMQASNDSEGVNTKPDLDGPIQLEFENGKILHINITPDNNIETLETPMYENKLDTISFKNNSLKNDSSIYNLIDNRLIEVSIISKEWVNVHETYYKTRYIICGIIFHFSKKGHLIYIHEKEGIPSVRIHKKLDISRYKAHQYIWEDPIEKITKREFHDILNDVPIIPKWETIEKVDTSLKWGAISEVDASYLNTEVFDLLVDQLKSIEDGTRFFALFTLIDKFRERLSNANDELADLMIQLLNDKYSLVVDRAGWALNIMGEIGLKKLYENVNSSDSKLRWLILATIGKSAHLNPKKSIEVLVEGVQDKNEDIRYIAMTILMGLCPLPKENNDTLTDFDFTPIYTLIKPIAKSFIASKNEMRSNSGRRYIKWIEEEEKTV